MDTMNIILSKELEEEDLETVTVEEVEPYDPRIIDESKLDWSRLDYTESPYSNIIDWTRLLYGNEQIIEKYLNKQKLYFPPDQYEYLFANISEEERPILVKAPIEAQPPLVDEPTPSPDDTTA